MTPDIASSKAPDPGLDDELARTYGLPPELASRIRGETADERRADAEELAKFTGKSEPEHVLLARQAIASAEAARQRESGGLADLLAPSERDRQIVAALHPAPSEAENE